MKNSVNALNSRSSLLFGNDLLDLGEVFNYWSEGLTLLEDLGFLKVLDKVLSSLESGVLQNANLLAFVLQPPPQVEDRKECLQVLCVQKVYKCIPHVTRTLRGTMITW